MMNEAIQPYQRLWLRLGLPEVWGWPLIWFATVVTGLASFAFDAVRLNNYSLNWISINAITLGSAIGYGYLLVLYSKRLQLTKSQRAGVNVFIASTAMGFKNLATFLLCESFGIADTGVPLVRFFGGVSIGFCLLIIYANMRGAKIERGVIEKELREKENALIGFRENASLLFEEEEQNLIQKSSNELLPRFLQLQEQVEFGDDVTKLRTELERFLTTEVRPLSTSLAEEAKNLRKQIPNKTVEVKSDSNTKFNLGLTIRVSSTTLLLGFAWAMLAPIILPEAGLADLAIASLLYFLSLLAIKGLFGLVKRSSVNFALACSPFPGVVASILPYSLLIQIPHQEAFENLMPAFLVTGGLACVALSLGSILDIGRNESEQKLKDLIARFSRENKLFEQRMWVAQHLWYTLLHGTVQSALTAAMIRSSNKETLSADEKKAIINDLNRAIDALRKPTRQEVSFEDSISDLKTTWTDIAAIDITIQPEAKAKISQSQDGTLVVNELLKEVVSNAVKHGSADQVKIAIDLTPNQDIYVTATNNGSKATNETGTGVGSVLFASLCTEHSLSWNSSSEETEFRATIPMA